MSAISDHHPVLLCFDGSDDATAAITTAGALLAPRTAVVLTAWEPVSNWEPFDPATVLSAPLSRLASEELGLDGIVEELAREKVRAGTDLARQAGFEAEGRTARGKPWRVICNVGDELHATVLVLGARGLSRVQSTLLGSVSAAVLAHTKRPVLVIPRAHHSEAEAGDAPPAA